MVKIYNSTRNKKKRKTENLLIDAKDYFVNLRLNKRCIYKTKQKRKRNFRKTKIYKAQKNIKIQKSK